MAADCLCQKRSTPLNFPIDYPSIKNGQDPVHLLSKDGYFIARGLLSKQEVEDCRGAVTDVCKKWYDNFMKTGQEGPDWEEVANRRPAWKEGRWQPEEGQEELGFRRLYRMTLHEEFFEQMCRHHKVSKINVKIESPWSLKTG